MLHVDFDLSNVSVTATAHPCLIHVCDVWWQARLIDGNRLRSGYGIPAIEVTWCALDISFVIGM